MAASHGLGAACYAAHVPERLAPGAFDNLGNSHNILHAALFGAYNYGYVYLRQLALRSGC